MTTAPEHHPDYHEEKKRLEFTKTYMDVVIKTAETNKEQFRQNMQEAFADVDWLESSGAYIEILTNASFFDMSKEELAHLKKARKKPYFARIDFKRNNDKTEVHYIGKTSLYQRENQEQLIVDWRSPIANLYYEGRLGHVTYGTEDETFEGELTLKRQIMIEDGEIVELRDIDLTTNDELLQESLAKSSSNRLTEIITTIQEEQNRIIRADLNKPIIVQGAAGSGKTTIALHRISYFIYRYKNYFDPKQLMILAPSRLFIDYISEALPELGVEKVRQTTFQDYVIACLDEKLRLRPDDKLVRLIEQGDKEAQIAAEVAQFKGSRLFFQILQAYVHDIAQRFTTNEDFYVDKYRLFSAKKYNHLLLVEYQYLPLYRRKEKLKHVLQNYVRSNKKKMLEKVEAFYDEKIEYALFHVKQSPKRKAYVTQALDKKAKRLAEVQQAIRHAVPSFMRQFENKKLGQYYKELFQEDKLVEYSQGCLSRQEASKICHYVQKHLRKGEYEYEDLGALLFLQKQLYGIDKELMAKNVVIDEGQDYSYVQLMALKVALETDMFTIVGDLAQGIHSYRGLQSWEEVYQEIFPRATYTELQKSYRTTVEIMEEANQLLQKLPYTFPKVTPVVRHGEPPKFLHYNDVEEISHLIHHHVHQLKKEGYQTFAIIGKTRTDCEQLYGLLSNTFSDNVTLLQEKASIPKDQLVIVPSYVSKGLEFDVVFICSLNEVFDETNELDVKLLYVAMTRPLHRLFFIGKHPSDFIR
jgi:DNA helicase II / ATP-dependent DNA helicase PcrA